MSEETHVCLLEPSKRPWVSFCGALPNSWLPAGHSIGCWGESKGLQRCSSKTRVTVPGFGPVPSPPPLSQSSSVPLFTGKTDHRNYVTRSTWEFCQALFWLSFHLLLIHNCMLIQLSDFFPPVHIVAGFPCFFLLLLLFVCLFADSVYLPWTGLKFKMSAAEYCQEDHCLRWHTVLPSGF